jgi:hypothetical protein
MTAQIGERLTYQGESLIMCTSPLSDFFVYGDSWPRFARTNTALWRTFIAPWEECGVMWERSGYAVVRGGEPVNFWVTGEKIVPPK